MPFSCVIPAGPDGSRSLDKKYERRVHQLSWQLCCGWRNAGWPRLLCSCVSSHCRFCHTGQRSYQANYPPNKWTQSFCLSRALTIDCREESGSIIRRLFLVGIPSSRWIVEIEARMPEICSTLKRSTLSQLPLLMDCRVADFIARKCIFTFFMFWKWIVWSDSICVCGVFNYRHCLKGTLQKIQM